MYYFNGFLLLIIGALLLKVATPRPGGAHRGTRQAIKGQEIQLAARVRARELEIFQADVIATGSRQDWMLA